MLLCPGTEPRAALNLRQKEVQTQLHHVPYLCAPCEQRGFSAGYANGLVNAIAAVVIGWAVDRYELRRTWVISAGCLLLGGMMVLEVRFATHLLSFAHTLACGSLCTACTTGICVGSG